MHQCMGDILLIDWHQHPDIASFPQLSYMFAFFPFSSTGKSDSISQT
jgi:hypothetical protein